MDVIYDWYELNSGLRFFYLCYFSNEVLYLIEDRIEWITFMTLVFDISILLLAYLQINTFTVSQVHDVSFCIYVQWYNGK